MGESSLLLETAHVLFFFGYSELLRRMNHLANCYTSVLIKEAQIVEIIPLVWFIRIWQRSSSHLNIWYLVDFLWKVLVVLMM